MDLLKSDLLKDPIDEISKIYFKKLQQNIPTTFIDDYNAKCSQKFVYTAMHGVGYPYILKGFEAIKLHPVLPVVEQCSPDPDFPTVKFPNPEEGKSCLVLSMKLAEEHGCSIIVANDPDADRLAIAEKDSTTKEWRVFNGNELGSLLGWWTIRCFREKYPDKSLEDCYLLASTVSSKMLKAMAIIDGLNFDETLTGFKWMGRKFKLFFIFLYDKTRLTSLLKR